MPRGEKIVVVAGHFACVPVLVSLHGLWSGNETSCTHAYKISKWRPKQRTAATECCEWLLLTRVNLKLWRRWVVGKLHAMMSISFMLKSRWVLEPFSSHIVVWTKVVTKKEYAKWHFCYCTLLRLAVSHVAFGHLYESCLSQRHSNKLLTYFWWSLLRKYCIYCASAPSLHKESVWYTQENCKSGYTATRECTSSLPCCEI